jgi:hypothetical protein
MIRKVVIRNFKRFGEVAFDLPGHIVLAGPNNTGKTTMLQAIAAWGLALNRWKERNHFQRHGPKSGYPAQPITRRDFSAVPLRAFDLLWNEREYKNPIEIELQVVSDRALPGIAMEFVPDSTEQIYVRPRGDAEPGLLQSIDIRTVFVPPMTGLGTDEPVYQRPYLDRLLGQGKPGDMLRNLLVEAHLSGMAWPALQNSIKRLFNYELQPPDAAGALIRAEYCERVGGPKFDIASAGSGFQQVLMLLAFLHTRPASVLLLDEPDAHLHMILQDAIFEELRAVAVCQRSQLVLATHSEVIINSVDPNELCVILDKPRLLASNEERRTLILSLSILSNTDIMQALESPGVLYTEDYTDLDILRSWATVLKHPAAETLNKCFWKKTVVESREGAKGIQAKDHYDALALLRADLPGVSLIDGDARATIQATPITGRGLQRLRWKRYEVESYLFHPEALARFVAYKIGGEGGAERAKLNLEALNKYLQDNLPPAVIREPLGEHEYLNVTKARTKLIPPALDAAGLTGFPYTSYSEIAAFMKPEEIHPEVKEKLDAIQKAFNL